MAYIDINKDTGEVFIKPEGKALPCVLNLLKNDKTKDKRFSEKVWTFIYHVYSVDHMYQFLAEPTRAERIKVQFLGGYDYMKILDNKYAIECIKEYKSQCFTTTQFYYEDIKSDIAALKQQLVAIPTEIDHKVSVTVYALVPDKDGNMVNTPFEVDTIVKINNSTERFKKLEEFKKLLELEDILSSRVFKEKKEKKKSTYTTLLEKGHM